jgi:hypothetical protein
MNPQQCRAARAWLDLTQKSLSDRCHISERQLWAYEHQDDRYSDQRRVLQNELESCGIAFTPHGFTGPWYETVWTGYRVMSPEQCKGARAWLGWSRRELADRSTVPYTNIYYFEAKREPGRGIAIAKSDIDLLAECLRRAGITLLFSGTQPTGIRVRDAVIAA